MIRRSRTRTSKKLKRWDIADRRSNAGNAGLEGDKARWFRHRDRKRIDPIFRADQCFHFNADGTCAE